jgi:Undecaprenyl-phosphate glucose phosphotransferase
MVKFTSPLAIKILATMSLQHHSPLLNHHAGGTSAVLPGQDVVRVSYPSRSLAATVAKLVIQEFLIIAGTAYLAGLIYHEAIWGESPSFQLYLAAGLFLAAAVELIALGFGHYKNSQSQSMHAFLWSGFGAVALAFSFLLSALFLLKITEPYSRATFVFQFIMVEFAVLAARAVFHARLQASIRAGLVNARCVVLIGDPARRGEFANRLKATGIQTVGSFSFPAMRRLSGDDAAKGSEQALSDLIDDCRQLKPDDILILARQDDIASLSRLIGALSEVPVGLHVVLVEAAAFLAAARLVEFGNVVTMQVLRPPLSQLQRIAKRVFDLAAATAGLVMLSPLLIAVAIAIKLDSRGPVLFRQRRHGYNNETIEVFKFRSMVQTRDEGKFVQAVRNDSRITRVGAVLRRTNIDELPQLINVLRGEMSIVGPRPHATAHNRMFEDKISVFSRRHVVKPGITGWAQVNGCRGVTDTLEKMQQRVEHDLYYIDNWSFWLDLRIIVMTVFSKTAYENAY